MNEYPRALHVGFNVIGSPSNTGLTLGSMFGAWPRGSLLELYTTSRHGGDVGTGAVMIPPRIAPLDAMARRALGSRIPAPPSDGMNNSISGRSSDLPFRFRVRSSLANLNEIGPVAARGSWLREVEAFEPTVIHSLLGTVRMTKIVASLAERLDLPVVPHFMDDWPSTLFADGQLGGLARRQVERSLARVLERAPLGLAIGDDMATEFRDRFGIPFSAVGNSVDFSDFDRVRTPHSGTTFVYAGGLHLGRDLMLAKVAASLSAEWPHDYVRLIVYAPPTDHARMSRLMAAHPGVVESGGVLDPKQVPGALRDADVLVFVESEQAEILQFTRLSVSTKVPEFLAARRPVLVLGPACQASVRALLAESGTYSCGEGSLREIRQALRSAAEASRGGDLPALPDSARELFGRHEVQQRLRRALHEASRSSERK